jgi:hypothetical protein
MTKKEDSICEEIKRKIAEFQYKCDNGDASEKAFYSEFINTLKELLVYAAHH